MFDRGKIKLLTHCKDKHRNSSDKLEHEKKKASVNRRSRLGAWLEQIVNGVASGRSGTRKRARSYHIFTTDKWDVITTANKSAQTALIYQQKVSRSCFFFFFCHHNCRSMLVFIKRLAFRICEFTEISLLLENSWELIKNASRPECSRVEMWKKILLAESWLCLQPRSSLEISVLRWASSLTRFVWKGRRLYSEILTCLIELLDLFTWVFWSRNV